MPTERDKDAPATKARPETVTIFDALMETRAAESRAFNAEDALREFRGRVCALLRFKPTVTDDEIFAEMTDLHEHHKKHHVEEANLADRLSALRRELKDAETEVARLSTALEAAEANARAFAQAAVTRERDGLRENLTYALPFLKWCAATDAEVQKLEEIERALGTPTTPVKP